ncbi:hypothetical protein IFM89_030809 [Coptis chinensis]|uniref:Protein kinase domain-containing protein n=1 Tax=Coptis chinensis TaxID=261450 RepID=A0A835HWJ2_9MAGN|nr:hypothetical protein IFM89_030809 [Coptis chinensis]
MQKSEPPPVDDDDSPPQDTESDTEKNKTVETEEEIIDDVSNKTWELSVLDKNSNSSVKGIYMYKNTFNLIPKSIGEYERLKTLKFFANEINLFPMETGNLVELECLQVKVSSPGISGLPLQKLKALKQLELFKVPPRPSAFPILTEIANLKCLTKLAVCHFGIRYLPPEIAFLDKLEDLDLSFNKLKSLPTEITLLDALKSLKVANNKLEELPGGLSSLRSLETLDLSNNRLTSLWPVNLVSMQTLKKLNLQYNKLIDCCQIPSWICCNLEGNGKDTSNDEFISSSIDVDIEECDMPIQKLDAVRSCKGSHGVSSSLSSDTSANRCSATRRIGKGWRRRDYLQQRSRQERLNTIRNRRSEDHQHMNVDSKCKKCKLLDVSFESLSELGSVEDGESSSVKDFNDNDKYAHAFENDPQILINNDEDEKLFFDSVGPDKGCDNECDGEDETSPRSSLSKSDEQNGDSNNASKSTPKMKRQFDDDLENPKPSKSQKPFDCHSYLSNKYSTESFCSINDRLPDGFYDAGRDRPFMPLQSYEQSLCLDSREVILVDREMDAELDVVASSAKALVSRLNQRSLLDKHGEELADDDLQRASLLALFVSNWFGGSDRSNLTVKARKAWSGSNYHKPFVCTCRTGNGVNGSSSEQNLSMAESFNFVDLCEKSLRIIKQARNSNIVPIGTLRWGVCRHRAVLMKYLCDRMVPPIPCELVRGYLDFLPHAWNIVPVQRDDSWVRMVVDACCPTDIREETETEYFCRYVPSSRIHASIITEDIEKQSSFPSLSLCEKVETAASSLMRYSFGSVEAVAKVRSLNTNEVTDEEMKKFEYTCLGEVRLLGALMKHSCIVEIYGHQISSKWVPPVDGNREYRILQSAIWMEYIEGGCLKKYMEKVLKNGEKSLQLDLALFIARDVVCALVELHSKDIIHRDVKSENVLIDLDKKRSDGTPVVKLCDFDRAIPLRSFSHNCCIAHRGIPPPDVCVGTPRWMAPEVLQTVHRRKTYGLEVDIWSYGCLLLELLTLQVPYAALPESDIHDLLQSGQRPPLTDELEALVSSDETATAKLYTKLVGVEAETETLRFLVYLFRQCTERNPKDRPTAAHLYEMLNARIDSLASSTR